MSEEGGRRKYTVKLTNREKRLIKAEMEVIGRDDLIANFDGLGHVYFYKRVWENYDLVYDLGKLNLSLYKSLMEAFDITYDNARRWVNYDSELLDYYNLGLKSNLKPIYKLKNRLLNEFGGTNVKFPFRIGTDDEGKPLYANVDLNLKVLDEYLDKLEYKRNKEFSSGNSEDLLENMIEDIVFDEGIILSSGEKNE